MSFQPINLGTPNNNDGDSLYVGGTKINLNFAELYTGLAGSSSAALKLKVGLSTPAAGTVFGWSTSQQSFIPTSANAIRTIGTTGTSALFVTDSSGVAGGADSDLAGTVNSAILQIDGRSMFRLSTRGNSLQATTRGVFELNLGNANVTSLSVYTTSVVVRGLNALEVYRSTAEDTATYTKLLDTLSSNTGITLYQTPTLDLNSMTVDQRTGADSSMAVAHTGFVKLLLGQYPSSSTQVLARRGLISTGTGDLSTAQTVVIDGVYHPKHCEGLIYNYNTVNNKVTLVTGAACHWSYNTSGVASVIGTTSIAMVASYTPIIRAFTPGWTPEYNDAGTTPAIIDGSISANTWYYMYYIGCLRQHTVGSKTFYPGSSNVVTSSNRDITSVDAQLQAAGYGPAGPNGYWQVVRRLGPIRTNSTASGAVPFNVKRIDHGAFEFYWGLNPNGSGSVNGADTAYTTTIRTQELRLVGSSDTFTLQNYSSAILTTIPPIPGITAFVNVKHIPAAGGSLPQLILYGDSWTVNSSISALYPPFETVRSMTTGLTNIHNIQVPMIPDGCYIPDGTYGGAGILAVTQSTGLNMRFIFQNVPGEGNAPKVTSSLLQFTVSGFRYAR